MSDGESPWDRRINSVYKSLFVPYALIFILYIAISVGAYPILKTMGFTSRQANLVILVLLAIGFLAMSLRVVIRAALNTYFRLRSRNPEISIKTQKLSLRFLKEKAVSYSCNYTVIPRKSGITSFTCHISWQGQMTNICLDDTYACAASLRKPSGESGTYVDVTFNKPLLKGSSYSFGYVVLVDDDQDLIRKFLKIKAPYLPEDKIELAIILKEKEESIFVTRFFKKSNSPNPFKEEYSNGKRNSYTLQMTRPVQGLCYYIGVHDI